MTRFTTLTTIALLSLAPSAAFAQFEEESVQAFLAADTNGDELLTRDEFRSFIQYLAAAGAPMSRRIRNLGAYGIAFNQTDTDGNGLLSPAELRASESRNR